MNSVRSTDRLREPPRDVLCLFLEVCSLSSKGFGLEQGSEEVARSRDNAVDSSIGKEAYGLEGRCTIAEAPTWKLRRLSGSGNCACHIGPISA